MRLHLVAFPHERIDLESASSFSANAAAFRDMMSARGHEVIVYDGARHEIFNETNKDEVIADLVAWLDGRLATS